MQNALFLIPEPAREVVRVSGADARAWLNGLVTCDLGGLGPAQGAYGLLLTKQGKIQSDLDIVSGQSGLLLGIAAGRGADLVTILDKYLVMEDAELALAPDLAVLRLIGQGAPALASSLGSEPDVVGWGAIDWLGLGGAFVVVARPALDRVVHRAAELGGSDVVVGGAPEWDALRIPRGFPQFGVDYGPEDNPHEAALDKIAVSFSKGCYLGQEVVCMQDMRGRVKRRLVPLRFASGASVSPGAEVLSSSSGDSVGQVTSVAPPQPMETFALARVRAPFFEGREPLRVGDVQADVVARPGAE